MECRPPSIDNHKYIIVATEYFTKWDEAMPTFNNTVATTTLFLFNHVINRFGVPKQLDFDHGRNFEDAIWHELSSLLGFEHQYSSSYYPQGNFQVEAVNKILKTMLQQTMNKDKTNWNLIIFPTLWAYRTSIKIATRFTPFHLVFGEEAVLPIECEIPSLHLVV